MNLTHLQGDAEAAPAVACVRCSRSEAEHAMLRDGQADDIKRRIWRALGQPCASFAAEHAVIFAQNQAAQVQRPRPACSNPAFNARTAAAAGRGAALARAMLERPQTRQGGNTHGS